MKDWTGDANSVWKGLGASNHTEAERAERDFYATSPDAARWLLEIEPLSERIWECASGKNHLADVFTAAGHKVRTSDIYPYLDTTEQLDFLSCDERWEGDIVTNPPYSRAKEFVEKALSLVEEGGKVCMFLKLTFLEGKARRVLFERTPPVRVWVSSSRMQCAKNGEFQGYDKTGSAMAYAWFVWERGYKGETVVKWFN